MGMNGWIEGIERSGGVGRRGWRWKKESCYRRKDSKRCERFYDFIFSMEVGKMEEKDVTGVVE